jgi:hypothetical protein
MEEAVRDLFKFVFTAHCLIENCRVTAEENLAIDSIPSIDVLDNLKAIVLNLLKFKAEYNARHNDTTIQKKIDVDSKLLKYEKQYSKMQTEAEFLKQELKKSEEKYEIALKKIHLLEDKASEDKLCLSNKEDSLCFKQSSKVSPVVHPSLNNKDSSQHSNKNIKSSRSRLMSQRLKHKSQEIDLIKQTIREKLNPCSTLSNSRISTLASEDSETPLSSLSHIRSNSYITKPNRIQAEHSIRPSTIYKQLKTPLFNN